MSHQTIEDTHCYVGSNNCKLRVKQLHHLMKTCDPEVEQQQLDLFFIVK